MLGNYSLCQDYENVDDVNRQLEKMGYNIGVGGHLGSSQNTLLYFSGEDNRGLPGQDRLPEVWWLQVPPGYTDTVVSGPIWTNLVKN